MPQMPELPQWINDMLPMLVSWAVRILGALAILVVAYFVAGYMKRLVEASLNKARFDATLSKFFSQLARWSILVLGLLLCLQIFGIQTTSIAAVIAAAGLAIGLAFQGTLSNFASGVMLLTFRPLKVGDYIVTHDEHVVVAEIELFYTLVDTFDNRRLIIPNSDIFSSEIQNVSYHPVRRVDVPVGVAYDADIDRTREVLMAAAESVEGQHRDEATGRGPMVVLQGLGDSAVDWQVRVWSPNPDWLSTKQKVVRAVKYHLDDAGLGIPFPQMDVRVAEPVRIDRGE